MGYLTLPQTQQSTSGLWVLLIASEVALAISILLYNYYALLLLPIFSLLAGLVLFPELAYFFFLFNIVNHILQFQIDYAFSDPPRLWRMEGIPVDIVLVPGPIVDALILVAAVSWLLARLAGLRLPYPRTAIDLPLAVFFFWIFLSLLWAPDWLPAFIQLGMVICSYLAFYLTVTVLRTRKLFHAALWVLLASGLANALLAIYSLQAQAFLRKIFIQENMHFLVSFLVSAKQRGAGMTYTLFTADFLNMVIMLGAGLFLAVRQFKTKVLVFALLVIITFGSLTTLSKGGQISLVGGLVFFIFAYKPARKYWYLFLPGLVAALLVLLQLLPVAFPWPERAEFTRERLSFFARSLIWENALEDLIATYGLGYGVGSFYFSHNLCLDVLFNFGIIGLAIWFWLLYRLIRSLWQAVSRQAVSSPEYPLLLAAAAGLVSILIFGLINGFYFEEKNWLLFGLCMALVNLASNPAAPLPESNLIGPKEYLIRS